VELQDAGATGNISVPHAWKDWASADAWLKQQIGKPYDWLGWIYAALEPFEKLLHIAPEPTSLHAFTCSSLVAYALSLDDPSSATILRQRTIAPDEIARYIGVI
jgi:cell wall-associated NlpC family hydrolase